ncbi:MAG: 2-C-methyl-D-erythritol 4-phosphate cytidylyltransferase [Chloroflexota bacterium]|nr:2-C-methyl-D-erythritol 4-phosphate cytidylyltransferase [Chloroflexota bacterium]
MSGVVAGIVLAGGSSSRMGPTDKLWAELHGRPLIAWSIDTFARSPCIDRLIVVARADTIDPMRHLLGELAITAEVVAGGVRRQDSVRAGLDAASDAEWVVVHDGARPCVTGELIERGLAAAAHTGAAIAAVPMVDTIKEVRGEEIVGTPGRTSLWAAQTPQIFRRELLLRAHEGSTADATDDAVLVEALGVPVRVFMGAYENVKVTNPLDLLIAEALLKANSRADEPSIARRQ